ncbi:Serine/threonine-protein kinase PknH [Aquisphaera giovannonii]|uniref:Serine/threonine-protein kinase PknH n=1 Tax=Aquisphaera giovannonii TaxID=406548 RepID=A0A5B9W0C2_9BACT|nr:serine/threonine-protein kinase [Aquisphaera giovannonii]QEH33350.1 Serine/threonine-protein kinase PknH [Aquisphaera giovannonii]
MDISTIRYRPGRAGPSSMAAGGVVGLYRDRWAATQSGRPDLREFLAAVPAEDREARIAILRADMSLRWRTPEHRPPEWYRSEFPDLDEEALLTLIYEEFCRREDAGESPTADEFVARFPDVAAPFLDVMEVHRLVGGTSMFDSMGMVAEPSRFPETGSIIGGYRIVEELGRGAFGRVYLAEERHLADRPVALKVTRRGSREPQTLARLQHTHIVPVYSYRSDPETGLHLLCMPFLGRTTLLHLLAHPGIGEVRSGADLFALLDRLEPSTADDQDRESVRRPIVRTTYARTIASWMARLAESLQHAHDRGVLHHDIKPSNVLVTADGLPMLLDFNLAQERLPDAGGGESIGGTLAYMSPERLGVMEGVRDDEGDERSDIYSLGMVLLDCLIREPRPFSMPPSTATLREAVSHVSRSRREAMPAPRARDPDVPSSLEAVVRKCLALDPERRYANAAELAIDLHAVADDRPLRFAREPLRPRVLRGLRRYRYHLTAALVAAAALGLLAENAVRTRLRSLQMDVEVTRKRGQGSESALRGEWDVAASQFDAAARLAQEDPSTLPRVPELLAERDLASETSAARRAAEQLFRAGEDLRISLLGFTGEHREPVASVQAALAAFSALKDPSWTDRPPVARLDPPLRDRLIREVNDILFLWAWALARDRSTHPKGLHQAIQLCDRAIPFARPDAPWRAIRRYCEDKMDGLLRPDERPIGTEIGGEFQWALLFELEGRIEEAAACLERKTRREPGDYWSQFYVGFYYSRLGQGESALEHYQVAVALRPDSPWARINRAILLHARGDSRLAMDDLLAVLADPRGSNLPEARLELGVVKQALGDEAGARACYDRLIAAQPRGDLGRTARLNRAKLEVDAGNLSVARTEYDALLVEEPRDVSARLGRAMLAIRTADAVQAEDDLTALLALAPERAAEFLARRAVARLARGDIEAALADATGAFRRSPDPARRRLWLRCLLACRRPEDLIWLDQPEDLEILPTAGRPVLADIEAVLQALARMSDKRASTVSPGRIHRARAVILSALHDPAAEAAAELATSLAPDSPEAYLVRGRVDRRAGRVEAAMEDVRNGLALHPGEPRLLELMALLELDAGRPSAALQDADRALAQGARGTIRLTRATIFSRLGRREEAVRSWAEALREDPEDPRAYLGRAAELLALGRSDEATADLDNAADWAGDNPRLLSRVVRLYIRCAITRPQRRDRVWVLARRVLAAWRAQHSSVSSSSARGRASK